MLRLYEVRCTYEGERVPLKLAVSDDEVSLQESYLARGYDSCGVDSIRCVDGYTIAVLDDGEYVAGADMLKACEAALEVLLYKGRLAFSGSYVSAAEWTAATESAVAKLEAAIAKARDGR